MSTDSYLTKIFKLHVRTVTCKGLSSVLKSGYEGDNNLHQICLASHHHIFSVIPKWVR